MVPPEGTRVEDTAWLRGQLQQREAEIRMLREITELVGGEHDLQTVFDRVAGRARDLIGAATVTIPVLSSDSRTYTYRAASGAHAAELINTSLPTEVGICGWVLRHRKAWWRGLLEQLSEQERNRWEHDAGSVILVPLVGRERILGGIAGMNKQDGGEFDQRDFDLLTLFARQVSVMIENAMYVAELSAARERAEAYREKLEALNARLKRTNAELQRLAVHDPLTGLPNRTLIMDRLQQAMREARRHGEPMALIMIDLDNFKEVNDTLGHGTGDSLLISVGQNLGMALREPDTLGRLGGDEFAVVLPQTDREAAAVVVDKLQAALGQPIRLDSNSFSVAASMGVAMFPEHGEDASSLMKCADIAMYVAKRNRDDFAFYDPLVDTHKPDRLELLQDLRLAIQNQELALALQPKLDIRDNRITGVEALARWSHPQRGVVPPYEFIPILEHTGLIKPFALQIMEKAAAFCSICRQRGFPLTVAVNLSALNLYDASLPQQIGEILDLHRLDRSLMTLEITESAIMREPERSLEILEVLDGMGLRIAVDDFGTGYSSLSYLKRLPVRELKIDRSFISEMVDDRDDVMIVRSTIDLAHNLGLTTVAEGVESAEILQQLRDMGCDFAQGYLISRPLSQDDLLSYLSAGEWQLAPAADAAASDGD